MTRYLLSEAVVGTAADLPDASDPLAGASSVPTALYIESDTGVIRLSTGAGWVVVGQMTVGTLPLGVTADGSNPPGLNVQGQVQAGSFGATDINTLSSFAGGITALTQGVTSSPAQGDWALDTYWNDGVAQHAAFRVLDDGVSHVYVDLVVHGKVRVGSSTAHTLGAYSGNSVPIYDEAGTLLGYMPLYA